jgi:hypothetical protein
VLAVFNISFKCVVNFICFSYALPLVYVSQLGNRTREIIYGMGNTPFLDSSMAVILAAFIFFSHSLF